MNKVSTLNSETKKTIKMLVTTLTVMISCLIVISLITTNNSAERGYSLQQNKLKNEELKNKNLNLTTKLTQATSFTKLLQDNEIKKKQVIEEKKYVTNEDNSVY